MGGPYAGFKAPCPACGTSYSVTPRGRIPRHVALLGKFDGPDGYCRGSREPFPIQEQEDNHVR